MVGSTTWSLLRLILLAAFLSFLPLSLCQLQSCRNATLPLNGLSGSIVVLNEFVLEDLCYYIEPRATLGPGIQPKSINITIGSYSLGADTITIYKNYFINKNRVLWSNTNTDSNSSEILPALEYPVFYIYYAVSSSGRRTFTISWTASTDTIRVQGLSLFVGVTISVLLVIIVACLVKVTLRRRLLQRALRNKRLQQRINTTPPRLEQIIVWTFVGISILLFVLFTSRAIRF
jgi:heme exporter protein D